MANGEHRERPAEGLVGRQGLRAVGATTETAAAAAAAGRTIRLTFRCVPSMKRAVARVDRMVFVEGSCESLSSCARAAKNAGRVGVLIGAITR